MIDFFTTNIIEEGCIMSRYTLEENHTDYEWDVTRGEPVKMYRDFDAVAEGESPERTEFLRRAAAYLSASGIRVGSAVRRRGQIYVVVNITSDLWCELVTMTMPFEHALIRAGRCGSGTDDFEPAFMLVANPPPGFMHMNCAGYCQEVRDASSKGQTFLSHESLHAYIRKRLGGEECKEWKPFGAVVRAESVAALAAAYFKEVAAHT
jgi:hypothetical protein